MAIAIASSLPLAVNIDSASLHESQLVGETLAGSFLDQLPTWLIGDKAYDSDRPDQHLLRDHGIKLIAPNRENRSKTQDGRKLRRYKRRCGVECLFCLVAQVPQAGYSLRIPYPKSSWFTSVA